MTIWFQRRNVDTIQHGRYIAWHSNVCEKVFISFLRTRARMPFDVMIPRHHHNTLWRRQTISKHIQRARQSFEPIASVCVCNVPRNYDCVELLSGFLEMMGESR